MTQDSKDAPAPAEEKKDPAAAASAASVSAAEPAADEKPAAPAKFDENAPEPVVRTTHFDFMNKVFKVPKARFYQPDNVDEPVFVVDLGDLQGELRLRALRRQFAIPSESSDEKLLGKVTQALKFIEDIRPGDKIPDELLDGSASWTVSPKHKQIAKSRLEAQLISLVSEKPPEFKNNDELAAFLAQKENRAKLREAFKKAAVGLGLKEDDNSAVLMKLELLARELCFIEALREAFNIVPGIAVKLRHVGDMYSGDMRMMDTIERVKKLLRKGVQEYQTIFSELDEQTSNIVDTMKDLDIAIGLIRERRDKLRFLQMKWTPLVRAWAEIIIGQGSRVQDLLGRTYRFLATRFDTSKSLMKSRKETEEQQRTIAVQQKKAMEALDPTAKYRAETPPAKK